MDFLDLIIFTLLGLNIALGWAFGLVRRIVAFAGLFAGVGAATLTSANTSTYIASTFGITSALWAHVITYAVIVTFAIVLFEVLGAVYQRYLDAMIAPAFDRLTGTLAGAVVGAFEVTVMLIIGVGIVRAQLPSSYATPPAFLRSRAADAGHLLSGPAEQHQLILHPTAHALSGWARHRVGPADL